jgi:N-acetylmuramoyl-L-alanine amidase
MAKKVVIGELLKKLQSEYVKLTAAELKKQWVPVYSDKVLTVEDYSDPEESIQLVNISETKPTCKNELELRNLISNFKFTRVIDEVYIHCTATSPTATVAAIEKYWKEKLHWKSPGYHIIFLADGSWTWLQDFNKPSNGVQGFNAKSIHLSYIGGVKDGKPFDTRTEGQKRMMRVAVEELEKVLKFTLRGHNERSNKACPSFNVQKQF